MENAALDQNSRQTLTAVSSTDGTTIVRLWADPTTHRLLVQSSGGGGGGVTVTTPPQPPNGSTTAFTVPADTKFIVGDGTTYFPGFGYTQVGTTATMNIAPTLYIRAIS